MKSYKVRMIALIVIFLMFVGAWMVMRSSRHSEHAGESGPEEAGHTHEKNEGKDEHGHEHKEGDGEEHGGEHGESEEEASLGGVGIGNAVTAADEHDGVKLSPKAMETMGIKTSPYEGCPVPDAALVFYQDKVGVYRLRDGWIKLIEIPHAGDDLNPGDQVVTQGAGLVRAAELDAFSGEVGHSH